MCIGQVEEQNRQISTVNMTKTAGQLKPFLIEEKREGPLNNISEATANKWIGNLTANIKKEENWLNFNLIITAMLQSGLCLAVRGNNM